MNYIFVDIDGPLLPAKLNSLKNNYKFHKTKKGLPTFDPFSVFVHNILAKHADAKIVLSTNWSWFLEEKKLKELLSNCGLLFDYANVSLTPKARSSSRSYEILWWINDNATINDTFLVIDDLPLTELLATDYNIKHIEVDLIEGLSHKNYTDAIRFLGIDAEKLASIEYDIPTKSKEQKIKDKKDLDTLYALSF